MRRFAGRVACFQGRGNGPGRHSAVGPANRLRAVPIQRGYSRSEPNFCFTRTAVRPDATIISKA